MEESFQVFQNTIFLNISYLSKDTVYKEVPINDFMILWIFNSWKKYNIYIKLISKKFFFNIAA